MASSLDSLIEQAIELPVELREIMVARLLESLDEGDFSVRPEIENAWEKEISQRISDFDSGKVEGVPANQIFEELRAKYSA